MARRKGTVKTRKRLIPTGKKGVAILMTISIVVILCMGYVLWFSILCIYQGKVQAAAEQTAYAYGWTDQRHDQVTAMAKEREEMAASNAVYRWCYNSSSSTLLIIIRYAVMIITMVILISSVYLFGLCMIATAILARLKIKKMMKNNPMQRNVIKNITKTVNQIAAREKKELV